jgi:threonyl-tRNA synthetase
MGVSFCSISFEAIPFNRARAQLAAAIRHKGSLRMPVIRLPDGSRREYPRPVSIAEIAADIGPGLARSALAGQVDGRLVDTSYVVDRDAEVRIVTDKDPEGLEVLRHSTAHLLAQAVKELYPEAQVTIGPVIEDGFYYDFAYQRGFTEEDLARIEARMREIAARDLKVERLVMPREEAIRFFREQGEEYKARIIEAIPAHEEISLYRQGEFVDLCRGPHVPSTGKLRAFKLTKTAGAYWRGDARNEMLARIYGTAWPDEKQLEAYLQRLEEAEKRDHRKLGRALDLFHMQEEAPGMVFWHERGWRLYVEIMNYMRQLWREHGYREVHTPQLVDRSLWEQSGHWEKFHNDMFVTHELPLPCPDLQSGAQELSRPPAAARRVRRLPPQRAVRGAARSAARARLYSGRCPYFLHRGANRDRGLGLHRSSTPRLR